jgi:hypothetical protein
MLTLIRYLFGSDFDGYGFDLVQKIFHLSLNLLILCTEHRNPTVSSNSWGFRASKGAVNDYYHFREDDAVQYGGTGLMNLRLFLTWE